MSPKLVFHFAVGLEPGDTLLIFTDGVPEALNPQDEEFGEDRLKAALQRTASLPVQEIVSQISGELKIWIQDAEQYDDVTLVVMKVR